MRLAVANRGLNHLPLSTMACLSSRLRINLHCYRKADTQLDITFGIYTFTQRWSEHSTLLVIKRVVWRSCSCCWFSYIGDGYVYYCKTHDILEGQPSSFYHGFEMVVKLTRPHHELFPQSPHPSLMFLFHYAWAGNGNSLPKTRQVCRSRFRY